jgi:hypothetical protein
VQDRRWAATGTELVRWYDVVGLVVDELADDFVVLLPVRERERREGMGQEECWERGGQQD